MINSLTSFPRVCLRVSSITSIGQPVPITLVSTTAFNLHWAIKLKAMKRLLLCLLKSTSKMSLLEKRWPRSFSLSISWRSRSMSTLVSCNLLLTITSLPLMDSARISCKKVDVWITRLTTISSTLLTSICTWEVSCIGTVVRVLSTMMSWAKMDRLDLCQNSRTR